MNRIYRYLTLAVAALAVFASCEEFQPVFTGKYPAPEPWKIYSDEEFDLNGDGKGDFTSIGDLVQLYIKADFEYDKNGQKVKKTIGDGMPVKVDDEVIIRGVVTTTDQPGNFYKSFYLQDATGGIEVKIGKNGLYNDYKQGQIVYIKCKGLYLGMYGFKGGNYGGYGMVSIGYNKDTDDPDKYENSSLDETGLVNMHVFRGKMAEGADIVKPAVIDSKSDLPNKIAVQGPSSLIGKLVTVKGLKYSKESFTLIYLDPNKDHQSDENRIFLSRPLNTSGGDWSWSINTWALKKERMQKHLIDGNWDQCKVGGGSVHLGTIAEPKFKEQLIKTAMPYAVSQYFVLDGMSGSDDSVQIRTSGFCKFADAEMDPDVFAGKSKINATGILSLYQGKIQLSLISLDDVEVVR